MKVQNRFNLVPALILSGLFAFPAAPAAWAQHSGHTAPRPAANDALPALATGFGRAPAAAGRVYTLEELERIALRQNPTLRQAAAEIKAAEGRTLQAGLYPNPTVGYSGEEIRGGSFGGGQQGFFIEQRIVTAGKLGLSRKVAGHEVRLAEIEGDEQRHRVVNAVRLAYAQLLAAQEALVTEQDLLQVARASARVAAQLRNLGQRDETEVLTAEIEVSKQEAAVAMREIAREEKWATLAALVGDPALPLGWASGVLDQDLPELDEVQVLEDLVRNSPALHIARANLERMEAAVERERREPVPDITIRAGLQQNRELLAAPSRRAGLQGFAEVGIQIPLFNRNQGNVASARQAVERSRQEIERLSLLLRERGSGVLRSYRVARVMARRYREEMLPRALRSSELMAKQYGLMAASYPQVLAAQHVYLKMRQDYIRALEEWRVTAVALQGYLLTDGLEAPARPGEIDMPVREVNSPSPLSGSMPPER
jgi:cobalt-zinc-cadmium efflux system outer membrane protein